MAKEISQIANGEFLSSKMSGFIAKCVRKKLAKYELHLHKDALQDLILQMRSKVLKKAEQYDAQKGNVFVFAKKIVLNEMIDWRVKEAKYKTYILPMTAKVMRCATSHFNTNAYDEQRRAAVRRTVRRLSHDAQILCQLIMECGVDQARETLKMSKYEFYEKVWPSCQNEFKRIYAEEWV